MTIDAHHHFWQYDPVKYDWISPEMNRIRADFRPEDLRREIEAAGIDGVVSVQARQTLAETELLLRYARENDFIKGVVGWLPLASPEIGKALEVFGSEPKLRGVRHVLQGEPDERYMLRNDFNAGIRRLKPSGLVYDILIFERHLPQTVEFVDLHPDQIFVVDHLAKPRLREGLLAPWNLNLRELARRENVFCKVSGLVTEADWSAWTEDQLRPYLDTVLEAFGPERTMFGSDWPVCLLACDYQRWCETVRRLAADLSADENEQLFGGTAQAVYKLA